MLCFFFNFFPPHIFNPHIQLQNGLVIPLSLACRSPEMVPTAAAVTLLIGDDSLPAPPAETASSARTMPPAAVPSSSKPVKPVDLEDEGAFYTFSRL